MGRVGRWIGLGLFAIGLWMLPAGGAAGTGTGPKDLSEVRAQPLLYLGQRLEVAVHLAPEQPEPDPLWTRFSPRHWRRVSAWGDRQFPWVRADYENPAPYLFVRRGSAVDLLLQGASPYERFLLRATVREVVMGEPWWEVHSALRVEPALTEGTVLHATRALELRAAGSWELAFAQLERALSAPMPESARAELSRLRERWQVERRSDRGGRGERPGR